jgi:hypothetical protein
MKYKLIKQKALLQIFLVISLTFYTSLSFSALNQPIEKDLDKKENKITYFDLIKQDLLQDVDAATGKVCCELTKQDSQYKGQSCVFTQQTDCDTSLKKDGTQYQTSSFACPQTDFCAFGVCKLKGTCQDNVEKGLCLQKGGLWNKGTSEEDPQCKVGCCDLPSGASLTTQAQCADKIKQFSDVTLRDTFKPEITGQTECLQQSRSSEEGCCVISSQNQCTFGTRKECKDSGGEFNLNTLCSKPGLNCQVTAKHSTICYQNKVYWADSSGNKENVYDGKFDASWEYINWMITNPDDIAKRNPQSLEDVSASGNCQFSLGSTCGDVRNDVKNYLKDNKNLQTNDLNKIKNQCISLNCINTIVNSKISWMDGKTRQNGESWCEYESITGNGTDLVGSRHIIHTCDNGIEKVVPCEVRRTEICVQNNIPGNLIDPSNSNQKDLTFAKCVPNNWQLCLAANEDKENCGILESDALSKYDQLYAISNDDRGPCQDFGLDEGQHHSCKYKTMCRKKACEEEILANCYFNKEVGQCAPSVPPGTLGKENEFKELTNGNNLGFSFDAKMYLQETSFAGGNPEFGEDCIAGCYIHTSMFANNWNSYCTSLGDLGAKYNVVGYYNQEGFSHLGPFGSGVDDTQEAKGVTQTNFNNYLSNIKPISGNIYALASNIDYLKAMNFDSLKDANFKTSFLTNVNNWLGTLGVIATPLILYTGLLVAYGIPLATAVTGVFSTVVGSAASLSVFGVPGIILAVIFVALAYVFSLLSYSADLTYKIACNSWVPPASGNDCRLCNDKSKFPVCDEYLCKSLGKGCILKNEGFPGNETCVSQVRGTEPAIITPLITAPFNDNDIIKVPPSTGYTGGYKFKNNITAFTKLEIGIQIIDKNNKEDFAECKISRFNNFNYDASNVQFFEDSLTKSKHIRVLGVSQSPIPPKEDRIELEAGKVNTFYIKCKTNDIINVKPYFIEIPVSKGPDTSPPEIKSFSIKNNAFIPYNTVNTSLTIYAEDQSGLENRTTNITNGLDGGCRYSTIKNQNYELMPYDMTCTRGKVNIDQIACKTTLNLKPNQENIFYFRCRDTAGNTNPKDSPPIEGDTTDGYHLFGTQPLKISQSGPKDNVLATDIKLTLTTQNGAENGKSTCYYAGGEKSLIQNLGDLTFSPSGIKFATTDASIHETQLSLLNEKDYLFYTWCRDIAGNEDNATIKFHTTTPDLNITSLSPNDVTIYSDEIQLEVTTVGGTKGDGDSDCTYKSIGSLNAGNGNINDYNIKTQLTTTYYKNITLSTGNYELEIECIDNVLYKRDKKTIKFEVDTTGTPRLIRVYKEGALLDILTNRRAECRYSPDNKNFDYNEATLEMVTTDNLLHQLQIANSNVFYIKCQDLNTKQISPVYTVYP